MKNVYRIFQITLRAKQIEVFFMFWISGIVSIFSREKKVWLFKERGIDARDNAYWLFKYIKENHPEISSFFIISKESPDYNRLKEWKTSLIEPDSFAHYVKWWQADTLISTHMEGVYPYMLRNTKYIYEIISSFFPKKIIDIKHGIIKDDILHYHHSRKNNLDLLICGAKQEYDFINEKYGYPANVAQLTGLARFDNLYNFCINSKQILLMPTWRRWYKKEDLFIKTEFFRVYSDLLTNKSLHHLLEDNGMELVFYPHHEIQPYVDEFKKLKVPPFVIIADKKNFDVQTLLKSSALLITDYSSVFFDFAYMKKPIIFFQFDENNYRKYHYTEGYYNYHEGLGIWTCTTTDLIEQIKMSISNHFSVNEIYQKRIENFFAFNDNHNCERIFDAIIKCKGKVKKNN